jgi:hypothetical protein
MPELSTELVIIWASSNLIGVLGGFLLGLSIGAGLSRSQGRRPQGEP